MDSGMIPQCGSRIGPLVVREARRKSLWQGATDVERRRLRARDLDVELPRCLARRGQRKPDGRVTRHTRGIAAHRHADAHAGADADAMAVRGAAHTDADAGPRPRHPGRHVYRLRGYRHAARLDDPGLLQWMARGVELDAQAIADHRVSGRELGAARLRVGLVRQRGARASGENENRENERAVYHRKATSVPHHRTREVPSNTGSAGGVWASPQREALVPRGIRGPSSWRIIGCPRRATRTSRLALLT